MKPKIDSSTLSDAEKKELRELVLKGIIERVLTDDQFEKELQKETTHLIDGLNKDKEEHIMARMLVFGFKDPKDGKRPLYHFLFADMPEPEKRQDSFKAIGAKLIMEIKQVPLYAILVTEAWTKKMSKEENAERARLHKNISDYEDKQECLIIAGMTIDGRQKMANIPINRDKDGNIVPDIEPNKPLAFFDAKNYLLQSFFLGVSIGNEIRNKNDEESGKDGDARN